MFKEKIFLLDMDGTIYLGNQLIDGALQFIEALRKNNNKFIFLTNNSSKSQLEYVEKLKKLGISITIDSIFSSTEATILYLKKLNKGNKVYLVGTPTFEEAFNNAGFEIISSELETPDFVIIAYDTTLTYEKVKIACNFINKGITYIATHPDITCPLENGNYIPDIGSILAMIKSATNKEPLIIGKPNQYIIDALIEKYNFSKDDLIIVGDRIYTDIATGVNCNFQSALVLTGETTIDILDASDIKPTYIFNSIKDIIPYLSK